jgi:hypothetical protein
VVGCLAGPPCGLLDACVSAGAGLGCHGSRLAIAVSPAGSVDLCCVEVMLVDQSQSSNCQEWAVLVVSGRAACRLSVFLVSIDVTDQ